MRGKKKSLSLLIPGNADSDVYHLGHSSHQNFFLTCAFQVFEKEVSDVLALL